MGVLEWFEGAFSAVVETVSRGVEAVAEKFGEFLEYVESGKLREAADMIAEKILAITDALLPVAQLVEALTGFPAVEIALAVQGVIKIGQFLADAISGKVDVPEERWKEISGHGIAAAEHFRNGQAKEGIAATGRMIQSHLDLCDEHPAAMQKYVLDGKLRQFRLSERFEHLSPQDLEDTVIVVPATN